MTGISDIFKAPPRVAVHFVGKVLLLLLHLSPPSLARILAPLKAFVLASSPSRRCPQPALPDPRPTLKLQRDTAAAHSGVWMLRGAAGILLGATSTLTRAALRLTGSPFLMVLNVVLHFLPSVLTRTFEAFLPGLKPGSEPCSGQRWAVLLPITSRGMDFDACWQGLEAMASSLLKTIPEGKRALTHVHVGIDMKDAVYDTPAARQRIDVMFGGLRVVYQMQPPAFTGKLCWIWESLAVDAVASGVDFFILLGDDVHMLDNAWQEDVESCFASVAEQTGLPFGVACVAIRDASFPSFPTFPVVHRSHLEIFGGRLFPDELINQHGDPFLFEIYRRWGASRFTVNARLENRQGGANSSRYVKETTVVWRDELLSRGIESVSTWLAQYHGVNGVARGSRVPCLDIVVPTYRCDESPLSRICALKATTSVSLHVLIIVDKPDSPNLQSLLSLNSYEVRHLHSCCACRVVQLEFARARSASAGASRGIVYPLF